MRSPLRPGDPRWLGNYRLEGRLGQGGMGTVFLGRGRDGRPVAIKAIKPEYAYEPEFRARFRSEVNRARQVPPFCTAELLDADADHETPYLVVEYVDGPSLAEVVTEQGPLTGGNLYSVAVGVATALAAIHGAGVIHRDLKPRNVLFALGTPKVIDFGIARAFEATSQHTGTDQMVGTVAYMAPERFDTASGRTVGPAADVFAWGVVVTYAGTGRTPFAGDSAAATAGAILTQPPQLGDLPAPLRDLVARTLDKDPARRPTAAQLLDLLLAAGAQGTGPELQQAARAAQLAAPRRPRSRWRRTAPLLAAAATVAVVGVGLVAIPLTRDVELEPSSGASAQAPLASPAPSSAAPASSVPPSAAAAPRPSATTRSATPTEPPATGPDGRAPVIAPQVTEPVVRLCRSADTSVRITAQSEPAADTQKAIVSVVNRSGAPCRIDGRVHLRLYNAADERVDVPTEGVELPGPPVEMILRAGGGAFQGIKWQTCDRAEPDCPTGNTLRGSLEEPAEGQVATLDGFPAPDRSNITMGRLQLGTLQPSTQAVVAW